MSSPEPDPPPVLPWRGRPRTTAAGGPRATGARSSGAACACAARCAARDGSSGPTSACTRPVPAAACGFAREHGQWVGSLDINTFVVAFGLMIASIFSPDWPLPVTLAVWGAAAIVVPLVTFRFTRGLWTAIVHLSGGVY